jgi:O-phospho-L-seryl-tRNASec:L-selenocysteinyl-tRNA synthase
LLISLAFSPKKQNQKNKKKDSKPINLFYCTAEDGSSMSPNLPLAPPSLVQLGLKHPPFTFLRSMDSTGLTLCKSLVAPNYIDAGAEALRSMQRTLRSVLSQRRCPEEPLSDVAVEHIIVQLSLMDSNNFPSHVGAGEREGRVFSGLVKRRHFYMTHGIGRSGDLNADQPKAAGSSLLYKLSSLFALDFMRIAGFARCESALVVPMATGMSIALVLRSVAASRPPAAKYVIWPRIDQRTSLKCIEAAGFVPIVVELRQCCSTDVMAKKHRLRRPARDGVPEPRDRADGAADVEFSCHLTVRSHADDLESAIAHVGPDNIVAVLCTTSCFAPRVPDDPLACARLAKKYDVPLIVNNAYGVQCSRMMRRISAATEYGRVDATIQSGDKNFLVPVGGSVVAGSRQVVDCASAIYAGRACASPIIDMFITFLSMGRRGFRELLLRREALLETFQQRMRVFATQRNEEFVCHPDNEISFGITLKSFDDSSETASRGPSSIGAALFRHCITGPKVVMPKETKTLCGIRFVGYGTHSAATPYPMLIMACGIGMEPRELEDFMLRLEAAWPAPSM